MGKRKREKTSEEFIRKLRRLEKRYFSKNESSSADEYYDSENDRGARSVTPSPSLHDLTVEEAFLDMDQPATSSVAVDDNNTAVRSVVMKVPEPVPSTSAMSNNPGPSTSSISNNLHAPTISEEILSMLGEAKKVDVPLGDKIPAEISERWGRILLDGLAKEQKEMLMAKMLIPENFVLAKAPKLNLEVASILNDPVKSRDKRLETAQNQLGAGIAGVVNLTKDLIQSDMNKLDVIKKLSEVSQILLDLHYEETLNRRRLIVPILDKNFFNIIKGVKRDQYLFGEELGENIKTSKSIEKSSQQIKKAIPAFKKTQNSQQPQQGNPRAPPRQQPASRAPPPARAPYAPPPPPGAPRRSAATTRLRPAARSTDRRTRR